MYYLIETRIDIINDEIDTYIKEKSKDINILLDYLDELCEEYSYEDSDDEIICDNYNDAKKSIREIGTLRYVLDDYRLTIRMDVLGDPVIIDYLIVPSERLERAKMAC